MTSLIIGSWTGISFSKSWGEKADIILAGTSNKENYIIGEPVTLEFRLSNVGSSTELVPATGVESGALGISISREEKGEYKDYFGSGWGRRQIHYVSLENGQSATFLPATILWNGKPRVSHLNQDAATEFLKGKITTEYAFPEPGVYFIKGCSRFGREAIRIESKPIRIVIAEPAGIDADVWNQIKGNSEIALLMQKGSFNTDEDLKKEELSRKVEQIFTLFPESVYSTYLKENMDKYRADELKRKVIFKKKS